MRTVLDYLCHRYPAVTGKGWESRFARGLVRHHGVALAREALFQPGLEVEYFREVAEDEPRVRDDIPLVWEDEDLIVADKPHFLPVIPTGPYVRHCLLTILRERTGGDELVPLHRLDRDTAGLVALARRARTRSRMAAVFGAGRVRKRYRAVCELRAPVPEPRFEIRAHVAVDATFWRRRIDPDGMPNSHTRGQVLCVSEGLAYVRLEPVTGRTHQLRLHMASIGCPIVNDRVYGRGLSPGAGLVSEPLQLLAHSLHFVHPISGRRLRLRSRRRLSAMVLL